MHLIDIFIIALGLAMDALAVSVMIGLKINRPRIGVALRVAISFGVFQAVMPLVGWVVGLQLKGFILSIDHWIAFGLLSLIGLKLIIESGRVRPQSKGVDPLRVYTLLLLSLGTSIDALIVGISFPFLSGSIIIPAMVIGGVTFLLSWGGVSLGHRFGPLLGGKADVVGGLFLIGMGVKELIEHLS